MPYLPGDLQGAVRLFESGTAYGPVTMGGASVDGSGVEMELTPAQEDRPGERLSDEVGFP